MASQVGAHASHDRGIMSRRSTYAGRVDRLERVAHKQRLGWYSDSGDRFSKCWHPAIALLHGVPLHEVQRHKGEWPWSDRAVVAAVHSDIEYMQQVQTYTTVDPKRLHVAFDLQWAIWMNDEATVLAVEAWNMAAERGKRSRAKVNALLKRMYDLVTPRWDENRDMIAGYELDGCVGRAYVENPPFPFPFEES